MIYQRISESVKEIRNLLKKVRLRSAVDKLEIFVALANDEELDDEFILLAAEFNTFLKPSNRNDVEKIEMQNSIIERAMKLLRNTRDIAIENAAIETGIHLEEVTQKTGEILQNLERINQILAQSRLLELEIAYDNISFQFSEDQQTKMKEQIERLKVVLGELD